MKRSGKITTTISAVAIYAMVAIPAMAGTTSFETMPIGSGPDGKDIGNSLLLVHGGNGQGGSSNSQGGSGDQDQDRDRDGSCLDSVTETTHVTALILAGNGNGSGDQDQDRDGSCDNSLTSNGNQTGDRDGEPDRDRDGSCQS